MKTALTAEQIFDRHYLEMRCLLLDLAAAFDRIDRADVENQVSRDQRMALIRKGLEIVNSSGSADRAERIQLLFSDPYVEGWSQS